MVRGVVGVVRGVVGEVVVVVVVVRGGVVVVVVVGKKGRWKMVST